MTNLYKPFEDKFNVYVDKNEVNCFTVMESMTPKQAEENADEWLEEQLEEEKLRHADIN